MPSIRSPYSQFFDLDGQPLAGGFVYIGTYGQNPETNPISVYWDPALTQPAAQPLRTVNGYISRAGAVSRLFAGVSQYSITVRNSAGALVYSELSYNALLDNPTKVIDVEDYGATLSDTVGSVNRAAIQAALDTGDDVRCNRLFTVDGPITMYSGQRLYADGTTMFSAGLNFKLSAVADIELLTAKVGSSLQDAELDRISLVIDPASTFARNTEVKLLSGSGRRFRLKNSLLYNYVRAEDVFLTDVTSVGNVATVTQAGHGRAVGEWIRTCGISNPDTAPGDSFYNGVFQIDTVPTPDTFTYVMAGVPTNANPAISTYRASYLVETATASIAVFRGCELSYVIPTFESFIQDNLFINFDTDLSYLGQSGTVGDVGLMVDHHITGNHFLSLCVDFANNSGNLRILEGASCFIHGNTFNSPSNNIVLEGDTAITGGSGFQIYGNYWEGGNTGRARIIMRDAVSKVSVDEVTISEVCLVDQSTGNWSFFGMNGDIVTDFFASRVAGAGIPATKKFWFDGVAHLGDTYIQESAANILDVYVGGANVLKLDSGAATVAGSLSATTAALSTTANQVLTINSTHANGGYTTYQKSGTAHGYIGNAIPFGYAAPPANSHALYAVGTLYLSGGDQVAANVQVTATALTATMPIKTGGYTVATLPAGVVGMRAYVTDATAPTYNAALVGGGGVIVPVFYNGAAWVSA